MMMDIASPAELIRVEQARFGDGRRQAYLTFLNEYEDTMTALSGQITLLNESGKKIGSRPVSFSGLTAEPGETFVCHLALDGYPEFDRMEMAVEKASFVYAKDWNTNPNRVIDCTPPVLGAGPERVALIAMVGHDAVCFPALTSTHWICVCGRFNRLRWLTCHRCGRPREETLALTPEVVTADYEEHVEVSREEDLERLKQRDEKSRMRKERAAAEERARRERARLAWRRALVAGVGVLAVSLAVWGAARLFTVIGRGMAPAGDSASAGAVPAAGTKVTMPPVDYLEPIG